MWLFYWSKLKSSSTVSVLLHSVVGSDYALPLYCYCLQHGRLYSGNSSFLNNFLFIIKVETFLNCR